VFDVGTPRAEAFYRRLLQLDTFVEPEPLIAEAVELITDITEARLGYVELFATKPTAAPLFREAHCDDGPPEVEAWVSRDIIKAAVEARTTINLASAADHPRFRMSASVVANKIRAVLCTPIGIGLPVGVVYVQGRRAPGRFPDVDRERAELFAAKLAMVADRIRARRGASKVTLDDVVSWVEYRHVRAAIDRNGGNLSNTARELGITRARLYRIVRRGV
jgi:transcriptional regulator with GAF, ATPase, and Fis domain